MKMKSKVVYYKNVDIPDMIVRHTIPGPIEMISARIPYWRESRPNSSYEREIYLGEGNCCLFTIDYETAKEMMEGWGIDIEASNKRSIADLLQEHGRVWFYITDACIDDFYSELYEFGGHFQNGDAVTRDNIGNIMGVHSDGTVGHISNMIWYNTFSVKDAPIKVDYAKYRSGVDGYVFTEPNIVPMGWEIKEKVMKRNFSADDIRNAREVHLFDEGILYVVDHDDEAFGFTRESAEWFHKANFWDYFESETMLSCFTPITKDEAAKLYTKWIDEQNTDNSRLEKAIIFATEQHSGQRRKGTTRPYILHPIETLEILNSMGADINLLIAGVLHDTVEDTDATEEQIRAEFGNDVAELVCAHSEDKSKSWRERKQHAINELEHADKRLKMLVMADKVSNLRSMLRDYKRIGNKLWERFNASVEKQAWYYSGIQDALFEMQFEEDCADVYWEMVALFKDVFVGFYHDAKNNMLYQVCKDGTAFSLKKGQPSWNPFGGELPHTAERISRAAAEFLEDEWEFNSTIPLV